MKITTGSTQSIDVNQDRVLKGTTNTGTKLVTDGYVTERISENTDEAIDEESISMIFSTQSSGGTETQQWETYILPYITGGVSTTMITAQGWKVGWGNRSETMTNHNKEFINILKDNNYNFANIGIGSNSLEGYKVAYAIPFSYNLADEYNDDYIDADNKYEITYTISNLIPSLTEGSLQYFMTNAYCGPGQIKLATGLTFEEIENDEYKENALNNGQFSYDAFFY